MQGGILSRLMNDQGDLACPGSLGHGQTQPRPLCGWAPPGGRCVLRIACGPEAWNTVPRFSQVSGSSWILLVTGLLVEGRFI